MCTICAWEWRNERVKSTIKALSIELETEHSNSITVVYLQQFSVGQYSETDARVLTTPIKGTHEVLLA
jgi:hypothetical protein